MKSETGLHVKVGYANPFLQCKRCLKSVPYWHNPKLCLCGVEVYNYPCEHRADVYSICPTWTPHGGCQCIDKDNHDN